MARFGLTIFLSAFLLFQVQPLIGKYILPWFGGGPAVWTTCLLFFQLNLLIGYGYTHLASLRLSRRPQVWIHLALLGFSLLFLPISPSAEIWKPAPGSPPTGQILLLLIATIGLPYLLLASTAPLVQRWFSTAYPGRSPYRLYALSNTGSLLALLSYPVVVEPLLALRNQVLVWSWSYAAFVLCSGWVAVQAGLRSEEGSTPPNDPSNPGPSLPSTSAPEDAAGREEAPSVPTILLWLGLSAVGSALLLATTNQMCQDVAVVPFLWILPLAIYLLTFIICFEDERKYDRRWFGLLVGVSVPVALAMMALGLQAPLLYHISAYSVTLFACCMCCHGELVRAKPHPRYLTLFYLVVAGGGALGGAFVALAAPRLFSAFWEYPLALAACALLTLVAWYRAHAWEPYMNRPYWIVAPMAGVMFAVVASVILLAVGTGHSSLLSSRSFYGILRLTEASDDRGARLVLTHGRVMHGTQFTDEDKRRWPTAYYGPHSAIGLAIAYHPRRRAPQPSERSLRVGVVGLGAGTIAALASPGDYIRFYEINPDVIWISDRYFTFRRDSPAKIDVVAGDARVRMEAELAHHQPQNFDVLAIDAFSSDAIPIHLLTKEAVDTYWRHLKPDGLLLFHISNQTLNLEPVVRGLGSECDCEVRFMPNAGDHAKGVSGSTWMLLTRNEAFLEEPEVEKAAQEPPNGKLPAVIWTDDFASLWQVLKF